MGRVRGVFNLTVYGRRTSESFISLWYLAMAFQSAPPDGQASEMEMEPTSERNPLAFPSAPQDGQASEMEMKPSSWNSAKLLAASKPVSEELVSEDDGIIKIHYHKMRADLDNSTLWIGICILQSL